MKFVATLAELEKIVRLKYDLTDDVKFEISDLPVAQKIDPITFAFSVPCIPDFQTRNKIPAIKMVRTMIGGGLAEAKWIVENWERYCAFLMAFRRFPILKSRDGGLGYEYNLE